MNLEQQVCSLELAKKLKSLGVKQESFFAWVYSPEPGREWEAHLISKDMTEYPDKPYLSQQACAFTVAELGDMIHNNVNEWAQGWNDSGCFYHFQYGPKGAGSMMKTPMFGNKFSALDSETEADARAEFLIHLIKEGVVKV
jgi:hypothetical protein